jgi:uncharacterized protein YegL
LGLLTANAQLQVQTMAEQIPFGADSFAENPEPRCPCVLLLDTSASMRGRPINELNAGLLSYREELVSNSLAAKRVELAIVTFGPVHVRQEFVGASGFTPPTLEAAHDTPMGAAICTGIELVTKRKQQYRQNGIAFYRPWIFLITDGTPTDPWQEAAAQVRQGEAAKAFSFFAVGLQSADMSILQQIAVRAPLKLEGLKFADLFLWLSNSQRAVSQSTPGTEVRLPAAGWATV